MRLFEVTGKPCERLPPERIHESWEIRALLDVHVPLLRSRAWHIRPGGRDEMDEVVSRYNYSA